MKRLVIPVLLLAWALIPALGVAPVSRLASADAAKPTFIGARKCKKCHSKTYKSWFKTPHATSFDVLKAGNAAQSKLKEKKDYTQDATCLKCHTTGYAEAGGYPAVTPGKAFSEDEAKLASKFEGVGCEMCHGAGSLFVPYKKKNKKTFQLKRMRELGAVVPPKAEQCTCCHKAGEGACPTIAADYTFDFEAMKKAEGKMHIHIKMKHDHGK